MDESLWAVSHFPCPVTAAGSARAGDASRALGFGAGYQPSSLGCTSITSMFPGPCSHTGHLQGSKEDGIAHTPFTGKEAAKQGALPPRVVSPAAPGVALNHSAGSSSRDARLLLHRRGEKPWDTNKLLLSCSCSARAVCPALPVLPQAGHSTSSCLIKTVIPMLLCLAERWERQQVAQGTETPLP